MMPKRGSLEDEVLVDRAETVVVGAEFTNCADHGRPCMYDRRILEHEVKGSMG